MQWDENNIQQVDIDDLLAEYNWRNKNHSSDRNWGYIHTPTTMLVAELKRRGALKMEITTEMMLACGRYYMHRARRKLDEELKRNKVYTWDRNTNLINVGAAANEAGWHVVATAGTFWFSRGNVVVRCDETNYLDGGIVGTKDAIEALLGSTPTGTLGSTDTVQDELKPDIAWDEANAFLHSLGNILVNGDALYDYMRPVREDPNSGPKDEVKRTLQFLRR